MQLIGNPWPPMKAGTKNEESKNILRMVSYVNIFIDILCYGHSFWVKMDFIILNKHLNHFINIGLGPLPD